MKLIKIFVFFLKKTNCFPPCNNDIQTSHYHFCVYYFLMNYRYLNNCCKQINNLRNAGKKISSCSLLFSRINNNNNLKNCSIGYNIFF